MEHIIKQIESIKDNELRENIYRIILNASSEINEPDIPHINEEFTDYYQKYLKGSIFPACLLLDHPISDKNDKDDTSIEIPRIVVIGDIHNDFNSISTILNKLALSDYDYFSKAKFIFLGDYIDRGLRPLETLRLIYAIKTFLGKRCIFLRGNHDLIKYKDSKLISEVSPANTTDEIMNPYLSPEVNRLFGEYCSRLPVIVSLDQQGKRYLLCHGGIPKDEAFPLYNEEKLKVINLPCENSVFSTMFKQMIWGDPVESERKLQGSESRFEFGQLQFKEFMEKNNLDLLIRGHEPVINGVKSLYDKKLFTVFSSGGKNNSHSYYNNEVNSPAFAIIKEDGSITFEHIFEFGIITEKLVRIKETDLFRFYQVSRPAVKIIEDEKKPSSLLKNIFGTKRDSVPAAKERESETGTYVENIIFSDAGPAWQKMPIYLNPEFYIDPENPAGFLKEDLKKALT